MTIERPTDPETAPGPDDGDLFTGYLVRVTRLGLVTSFAIAILVVLVAIREDIFLDLPLLIPVVLYTTLLAVLATIRWERALKTARGARLGLVWALATVVGLFVMSLNPQFNQALFLASVVAVAFTGAAFPLPVHGFFAVLVVGSHVFASVLQGVDGNGAGLLAFRVLSVAAVAAVTGLVGSEFRRQAVRSNRQVQELARREADLERLYDVSSTVGAGSNFAMVLPELVGKIANYLGARVGLVLLHRSEDQSLEVVTPIWVAGHSLDVTDYRLPLAAGGTAQRVFTSGEPLVSNDVGGDPDVQDSLTEDLGVATMMAVPLRAETRKIGVLMMADKSGGDFTAADLQVLQSLAAPAALVLDQLASYERAEETSRRMEELATLKTDFVSVVSHELRTPLTSIIGSLATISRPELAPASPAAKDLLASARKQAARLRTMIEDLLVASQVDARALPQSPELLELGSFLDETIHTVPGAAALVTTEAPDAEVLEADPAHLARIITNLVDNAIKHGDGAPVEVVARREDDEIWISVIDHGSGIPPEHRDRAFERFSQLAAAQTRTTGGTGLGLSIVKSLAESMGGRVWLDDTPGGGATFTVALPRTPGVIRREGSAAAR